MNDRKETLLSLLDLATSISAEDMHFVRREIWNVNKITLMNCKREVIPSSLGSVFCNLKNLNLQNNEFKYFPDCVLQCLSLESLDLSRNNMRQLSDRIGDLMHLTHLDVSSNQLIFLPLSLSTMRALSQLSVKDNALRTLHLNPSSQKRDRLLQRYNEKNKINSTMDWEKMICPFKGKEVFYNKKTGQATNTRPQSSKTMREGDRDEKLMSDGEEWEIVYDQIYRTIHYYNHLTGVMVKKGPDSIDKIGDLSSLKRLDVGGNMIERLPQSFAKLSHLEIFDAPANHFAEAEAISSIKCIRSLRMNKNCLKKIAIPLSAIETMEYLNLSQNCLNEFPHSILGLKRLRYLNLNLNAIRYIPYKVGFLASLKELDVTDNPIVDPPYAKMIQSTEKVLWWCREAYKIQQKKGHQMITEHKSGICQRRCTLSPDFHNRILEIFNDAACTGQGVDLQFRNLTKVPNQLFSSRGIQHFDLSHNPLARFPVIPIVNSITRLRMKYCGLHDTCASISNLKNLETLDLEGNKVTCIQELMDLTQLVKLNLSTNKIKELPQKIGNLKHLKELNIDHNQLLALNEALGNCSSLESLSVCCNKLECIETYLFSMSSLRDLDLSRNFIKMIPEGIGKMSLIKMSVAFNEIERLHDLSMVPCLQSTL